MVDGAGGEARGGWEGKERLYSKSLEGSMLTICYFWTRYVISVRGEGGYVLGVVGCGGDI